MISAPPGCPPSLPNPAGASCCLAAVARDYPLQDAYLGATVRRYANRIANASLLTGNPHALAANQAPTSCTAAPTVFAQRRRLAATRNRSAMCCTRRGDQLPAFDAGDRLTATTVWKSAIWRR
ncbi:hypothetical protein M8494_37950 [Serratia ureilytica]